MLNEHNQLVKAFRCARERLEQEGDQKLTLRLLGCNTKHDVQYNLPSSGEIAAIIVVITPLMNTPMSFLCMINNMG
jgi:hypothetical protein